MSFLVLYITRPYLGQIIIEGPVFSLLGALALKHCPFFFRIGGFVLISPIFNLFIIRGVFSYYYCTSRCFCPLGMGSNNVSIDQLLDLFFLQQCNTVWNG